MTMQISGFLENTDWSDPDAVILIQFSRVNSFLSSLLQITLSCIDWVVFLSSGVCLAWGWSERSREIWGSHSSNGKALKVAQSTAVSNAYPCPPSCQSYKLESKGEEEYRGSWLCYHDILLAIALAVACHTGLFWGARISSLPPVEGRNTSSPKNACVRGYLSGHCSGLFLRVTQDWGGQPRAWGSHFHAVCDLKINTCHLLTRLILSSFPGLRELWSIWKDLGRYSDNTSKTRLRTTEFHWTFSSLG